MNISEFHKQQRIHRLVAPNYKKQRKERRVTPKEVAHIRQRFEWQDQREATKRKLQRRRDRQAAVQLILMVVASIIAVCLLLTYTRYFN